MGKEEEIISDEFTAVDKCPECHGSRTLDGITDEASAAAWLDCTTCSAIPLADHDEFPAVFDETSLHQAIIKTWGEHGAHNDVFTEMRRALRRQQEVIDSLREQGERQQGLLQRVHDDLLSEFGREDLTKTENVDRIDVLFQILEAVLSGSREATDG